ncbi:MAG: hypothetical protein ACPGAI_03040 [Flavobacteriaceae bacterium]
MKLTAVHHTVVIEIASDDPGPLIDLLMAQKERWQAVNVILDLHQSSLVSEQLMSLIQEHKQRDHSFVIVDQVTRIADYPENMSLAPTLEEAHDLIEMEEIERDLGF